MQNDDVQQTCASTPCESPGERECARPLVLAECLERRQREAEVGILDTGRYRCRYAGWGRGPTLVIVPGMCSEVLSYVLLQARLSTQFRCIAYDLPTGVDDGAQLGRHDHAGLVHDLFALLNHLDVRSCAVFGHSFGSTIALAAAAHEPGRFERLILAGGWARRRLAPAEVFAAHWACHLPGTLGHIPFRRWLLEQVDREPFQSRPEADWRFYLERHGRTPLRAAGHRAMLLHELDLRPSLRRVTQPSLLVFGDRDRAAPVFHQELRAGLRNSAQAEIEGCGHQPHLSHPEVLAEIVTQFLQPASCPSAAHPHA